MNHLVGHGLVVGTSEYRRFAANSVLDPVPAQHPATRRYNHCPSSLNPHNIQTRNLAAAVVTVDLPAFARVGARVDALVSALGDARSLQGGTLMMTPLRGADGRVYALAQGPMTVEGYFASASGRCLGAQELPDRRPDSGRCDGRARGRRRLRPQSRARTRPQRPDAAVAMRAADAITRRFTRMSRVAVTDPGTLARHACRRRLSAVSFAAVAQ